MNIALIFAGGSGTRMSIKTRPKQFLEVDNKPIIIHTIEKFEFNSEIDIILVVCLEAWIEELERLIKFFSISKVVKVVAGGSSAQNSQHIGLSQLENYIDRQKENIVLIHDGVRPLITDELINENIIKVKTNRAAITVTPAVETVVERNENLIGKILNRNECLIAKAPQSFYYEDILSAHIKAIGEEKVEFIDSASLMNHYGYPLSYVVGSTENIKITTSIDFYVFKAVYEANKVKEIFG